jgi:hypothetical protein
VERTRSSSATTATTDTHTHAHTRTHTHRLSWAGCWHDKKRRDNILAKARAKMKYKTAYKCLQLWQRTTGKAKMEYLVENGKTMTEVRS